MGDYAHPEVLVSTDWVLEHKDDENVRLIEIDVDTQAYKAGHIPGAVGLNWQTELQDQTRRDILDKAGFEKLMSRCGVKPGDTLVLYGDNNNWFAAYGFWLCKIYGHQDVRLMNGGRVKWLNEDEKPFTTDVPSVTPTDYKASGPHLELRTMLPDVLKASGGGVNLVDVRSPDEFTGKVIAPPGMNETAQRGGHIPGAKSVPWVTAVNSKTGEFKPADELRSTYIESKGVDPSKPTIAYCRIGERSSHTWFVLRYLIGLDNVANYDGSWTEYGNVVGAPIER